MFKLRKFHKWLGLFASIYVLMAVISGLTHIVMSNFFAAPPPVIPQSPVNIEKASLPIATILKALPKNFGEVKGINLRIVEGELYYQFISGEKGAAPLYVDALKGTLAEGLDAVYAKQIAAEYLRNKDVTQKEYLTAFNNEYLNIYRMLPAYRFDDSDERVYVSTITGSTTLYLNKYRAFSQYLFSYLHKFSFISNKVVKDIALGLSALSVLVVSIMGVVIFYRQVRRA